MWNRGPRRTSHARGGGLQGGAELCIQERRHPVLEGALQGAGTYVPNSVQLRTSERAGVGPRCMVITGPNMGGKSSFIRQVRARESLWAF